CHAQATRGIACLRALARCTRANARSEAEEHRARERALRRRYRVKQCEPHAARPAQEPAGAREQMREPVREGDAGMAIHAAARTVARDERVAAELARRR